MESPVKREVIDYDGPYGKGTIVVNTAERRLYFVVGDGTAVKYGIGVGRPGFTWNGTHAITRKAEWPGWTPAAGHAQSASRTCRCSCPAVGQSARSRAMYNGSTIYRIHGTAEPWTIGQAVSSGCIRMTTRTSPISTRRWTSARAWSCCTSDATTVAGQTRRAALSEAG